MKTRHQNTGQWRALRVKKANQNFMRVSGVVPTLHPGADCHLRYLESLSSVEEGIVLILEHPEFIELTSTEMTFVCSADIPLEDADYLKVVVVGFWPGERRSKLIALLKVEDEA